MASPELVIRRVVVSGELTLDLAFDRGLNVLYAGPGHGDTRLANKAGKTGLVELIQYGLGRRQRSREQFHFEPIMSQLGFLWLEVELNGRVVTIQRSLQDIFARVVVRDGSYVPESGQLPGDLVDVEALSSRFLSMLGIPDVAVKTRDGDLDPLTFPSLMRAFVLHQDDSFAGILYKVQPERRKTDIIGLLTRVIPERAFDFEEQLSAIQRRLQTVTTSRDAVRAYLREQGQSIEEGSYEGLLQRLEDARVALARAITARREAQTSLQSAGRSGRFPNTGDHVSGQSDRLRAELLSIKAQRAELEGQLTGLVQEQRRLNELISSLSSDALRVERLRAASVILSSVDFDVCPRCTQEITDDMRQREHYSRCALCNRALRMTSDEVPRSTPDSSDIAAQRLEASEVLGNVESEREEKEERLARMRVAEAAAEQALNEESAVYVAPAVDQLLALSRDVAEREAAVAATDSVLRHADALRGMQKDIDDLTARQLGLQEELDEARRRSRVRVRRLERIYRDILERVEFPDLRTVRIQRNTLMPYINGSLYTHGGAALTGLATVCYHLALLRLSTEIKTFFPRMLVIDSPAVGDLNEHNHRLLLDYLASVQEGEWTEEGPGGAKQSWQIILTERRMTPRLQRYQVMEISNEPGRRLLRPAGR